MASTRHTPTPHHQRVEWWPSSSAGAGAPAAQGGAKLVLLSDLGGTNARFELGRIGASGDADEAVQSGRYPTVGPDAVPGSGSGFEALVARFLADAGGVTPDQCVLAVCGPVTDGAACERPLPLLPTTAAAMATAATV